MHIYNINFTPGIMLGIILFLATTDQVVAKRQVAAVSTRYLKFVSATMKVSPQFVSNYSAWIKNGTLNIEFTTIQTFISGIHTTVDAQIRLAGSERYQTIFSNNFDICVVLNNLYRTSIGQKWIKSVLRHSNIKQNCPIEVDHYYIHGLIIDAQGIPSFFSGGDYRVLTHHYYAKPNTKTKEVVAHFTTDLKLE